MATILGQLLEKTKAIQSVTRDCREHVKSQRLKDGRCSACYQRAWKAKRVWIEETPGAKEFVEQQKADRRLLRKEKAAAAARQRRIDNPETERAKDRARCRSPKRRASFRLRIYKRRGITREIYEQMVRAQRNRCAICLRPDVGFRRKRNYVEWHVDHDHKTGKVRGLLCTKCNIALGLFLDSEKILTKAIQYLQNSR